MNDDPALAAVSNRLIQARDLLAGEHMTIPASEIIARDRKRRARHRLAAAGAASAAIGLAVALTLAPGSPARPAPRPDPRHLQLAAWTVHTNRDSTVTLILRNTSHPVQLQRALAKAGVPAVVRWGEICQAGGPGQPAIGGEGSFMKSTGWGGPGVGAFFAVPGGQGKNLNLGWSWTIIPSKIPHGGHFVISAIPGPVPAEYYQGVWEFVKTSAPITCAKHVDN
jgi:hypothetical protein